MSWDAGEKWIKKKNKNLIFPKEKKNEKDCKMFPNARKKPFLISSLNYYVLII